MYPVGERSTDADTATADSYDHPGPLGDDDSDEMVHAIQQKILFCPLVINAS